LFKVASTTKTYTLSLHDALPICYDAEKNTSSTNVFYEGGVYYRYVDATPGDTINGGVIPAGVTQMVRERFYSVNGDFEEKLTALDRKSTRLNSSHVKISYAVFCL